MRFEIRAGGALLILIGLAALSGVVFALGLVAGYEMARQTSPEGAQVANVYPLPGAPQNAESSPQPSPAEASLAQPPSENPAKPAPAQPMAASSPASAPSVAQSKPPPPPKPVAKASPPVPPVKNTVAAAAQPRNAVPPPSRAVESDGNETDEAETPPPANTVGAPKYASASVSNPGHHKPFNIQIDAVMDYANAQQMATRLQKLGYHAFLVPTDIDGQRWWRVRIGPFGSAEEAQSAEQELRSRYRNQYTQ